MTTFAMIDIETLNTAPDSVILSVGAVKFNPYTHEDPYDHKHWRLDIDSQFELGRTVSESTLEWWGKQASHIRDAAFSGDNRIGLLDFAKDLNRWLTGSKEIWCQGPQFDMVMLENLFQQCEHHRNWAYWQIRDSRTLFSLMPVDPRKNIQQDLHDALADAFWQAKCVQQAFSYFGIGTNTH
jgi:hypothetical protein